MPNLRIMTLGDSLTAQGGANSYQLYLYPKLKNVELVGSQNGIYGNHEGHPGFTLNDINANVATYLTNNPADVVLLLAGVNDINSGQTATQTKDRLSTLLDTIASASPSTVVIYGTIPPVKNGGVYSGNQETITNYTKLVPEVLQAKRALGRNVLGANLWQDFLQSYFSDDIHQNLEGAAFIASRWLAAILHRYRNNVQALEQNQWRLRKTY